MQVGRKLPQTLDSQVFNWVLIAILAVMYVPLFLYWADGWLAKSISIEHEYFSHGLIGFPFAGYIAWTHRHRWQKLANKSHPLGAGLLTLGGIFYLSGLPDFINLSFPLVLTGLCLWLKGIPGLRLQWFPLLLVWLATPTQIPYLLTPYTLPLQTLIAGVAGFLLVQIGIDVTIQGIYLYVGDRIVEVAPYCAGLKMLFTSLYVGLILLYWTGMISSTKRVITLLTGAAAISIIANILRNTLLAFFHGTQRDGLFDLLHEGWGGDLYSACMLGLIVLFASWMDNTFPMPSTKASVPEAE